VQEIFRHTAEVTIAQWVQSDVPPPAQIWDIPALGAVGIHQHTNRNAWKSLAIGAQ